MASLRKTLWYESGNGLSGSGSTERVSYPAWMWLLDSWLAWAHPHWSWWGALWAKLSPNWGDPFEAAYCFAWSNFYVQHERVEYSVNVGFARLSQHYRDWYAKINADPDEE